MDLARLRKCAQDELLDRARAHTVEGALMGHCIESGYGLVDDEGRVIPLDTHATDPVVRRLREQASGEGVRLRVERERDGEEMRTRRVTRT